jgi:hypothetical protein
MSTMVNSKGRAGHMCLQIPLSETESTN